MRKLTESALPEGRKAGDAVWATAYRFQRGMRRMDLHQKPVYGMLAAAQGPDAHARAMAAGQADPLWFVPFKKDGQPDWRRCIPAGKRDYADSYSEAEENYDERVDQCLRFLLDRLAKVRADRIRPSDRITEPVPGVFVSEWDDGETTVESPCTVDLLTREVVIDAASRTVFSEDPDIDKDTVDDAVCHLDREYVWIGAQEFAAYPKEELDPNDRVAVWYE